jgi:hypothetical protein
MDRVFIEDLRIETTIGIYDWEKKIRQVVAFDIEMAFDNRVPAGPSASRPSSANRSSSWSRPWPSAARRSSAPSSASSGCA